MISNYYTAAVTQAPGHAYRPRVVLLAHCNKMYEIDWSLYVTSTSVIGFNYSSKNYHTHTEIKAEVEHYRELPQDYF